MSLPSVLPSVHGRKAEKKSDTKGRVGKFHLDLPSLKLPENQWLEDVFSFWDGLFSEAMLVLGRVDQDVKKQAADIPISFQFKFVSIHNMLPTKRSY